MAKLPRLCDSCLAAVGKGVAESMSARNFGPGAAWPMTRLTHEAYLDREANRLSPFTSITGWKLETCAWDWMHNVYLGCGRDLFAGALRVLIAKNVWPVSDEWDTILHTVHMEMHETCAKHGPHDPKFSSPDVFFSSNYVFGDVYIPSPTLLHIRFSLSSFAFCGRT